MYEYKFPNSRVLVLAFLRLGPRRLFDFLVPHFDEYRQTRGDLAMDEFQSGFLKAIIPLFNDNMNIKAVHDAILGCCSAISEPSRPHAQDNDRLFKYVAFNVYALDNQPDEALRQIETGELDANRLRLMHVAELELDPVWVVHDFISRECRWRPVRPRQIVTRLVELSFGRIAVTELRKDAHWLEDKRPQFWHVVDWLIASVRSDARWLKNTDDLGRPKKLMKCGSLDILCAEADKHMRRNVAKVRQCLSSADEETLAEDKEGFRIVRLKTPAALDAESSAMGHCIGNGAYDELLSSKNFMLLSLRDGKNQPHATMEVGRKAVVQFRAKANGVPKPEYRKAAEDMLSALGIEFNDRRQFRFLNEFGAEEQMFFVRRHLPQV